MIDWKEIIDAENAFVVPEGLGSFLSEPHLALREMGYTNAIKYLIEHDYHFRTDGKRVAILGGAGSGYKGHSGGRGGPGNPGGSRPRDTAISGIWSLDERTADYILNQPHYPGEIVPEDIDARYDTIRLRPGEENYGDWARGTLAEARSARLVDSADFLNSNDLMLLRKIEDKYIWRENRQVRVVPESEMPKLDRAAVEREYGISQHALLSADLRPTGSWSIKDDGFHFLVSEVSENKSHTFWHEFGHTCPSNVIAQFVGEPGDSETAGEYMNRFATKMSGENE